MIMRGLRLLPVVATLAAGLTASVGLYAQAITQACGERTKPCLLIV